MARRLKTYITDGGFYRLAVAAPSMKAALEAWEMKHNAFQQGLAQETHDPAIIAATEASPGRVLRRPIGTNGTFKETPDLPKVKDTPKQNRIKVKPKVNAAAVKTAEAALEKGDGRHRKTISTLDEEREKLDSRVARENDRWQQQKGKLEAALWRLKGS